mmetsp:Transcript_13762/g.44107  ORF Transcript_13762/g.44107 Transcript_13762/m.44107 type:complete len:206 (+) Transcript_13762:128-745(+)
MKCFERMAPIERSSRSSTDAGDVHVDLHPIGFSVPPACATPHELMRFLAQKRSPRCSSHRLTTRSTLAKQRGCAARDRRTYAASYGETTVSPSSGCGSRQGRLRLARSQSIVYALRKERIDDAYSTVKEDTVRLSGSSSTNLNPMASRYCAGRSGGPASVRCTSGWRSTSASPLLSSNTEELAAPLLLLGRGGVVDPRPPPKPKR